MLKKSPWRGRNGTRCASNAVSELSQRTIVGELDSLLAGLCKKMLEPMIMAEHEGDIFCKQCYGRKFGFVHIDRPNRTTPSASLDLEAMVLDKALVHWVRPRGRSSS